MSEGPRTIRCAARAARIAPFYVMELLERARAMEARGEDIVHMEIGEPDFATPECIKDAAIQAIRENHTFYTQSLGIPELKLRIAAHYLETDGVRVDPERIVITDGTSGAFFLLAAVLLDRERCLVVSDPGYPCYRNFATLVGARVVPVEIGEETAFQLTPELLEKKGVASCLVMIANPSNPTGIVYEPGLLEEIRGFLAPRDGILLADEIYSGLTYEKGFKSAISLADDVIVVNGFSKTYAMTGFRLGWMVVPPSLVRPIQKVAQNVFISPPTISQYAALAAFDAVGALESMRDTYRKRRDFLFPRLEGLGFRLPARPEGAFYIYAGIESWGIDSMRFAERALEEAHVALTPGYDFGGFRAGTHVRFSYATSLERIEEGCRRLESWLNRLS